VAERMRVEPTGDPVPYPERPGVWLTGPASVLCSTYWRRRLADGSVRLAVPSVTDEAPAAPKKKKKGA